MGRASTVLVVGPTFLDSIYGGLPSMPELGQEVYGDGHLLTVGGFAITAIGLARLGVKTLLATAIGDDLFGNFIEERLTREGVSTRALQKLCGRPTNSTTAFVYQGDRGFISFRGAELPESELVARWEESRGAPLNHISHLHIGLREDPGILQVLQRARKHSVITFLTCGWDGVELYGHREDALKTILGSTNYFLCNQKEAVALTGQSNLKSAIQALFAYGCHPVITLGSEGALTLDENQRTIQQPAIQVDFVDPTGAGDSFAAGFIAGQWLGWSIDDSMRLGVVCGSLSTQALGGTEGFPRSLEDVLAYIPSHDSIPE